jgi:hypothetical protein
MPQVCVVGLQIWPLEQDPGVQVPVIIPASIIVLPALHLPLAVSHVEPDGHPLVAVHFAPQIFVAGWHT